MKLIEFDVPGSTYVQGLKLKNRIILEERSIPLCFGILPKESEEQFLLVSNEAHKIRNKGFSDIL